MVVNISVISTNSTSVTLYTRRHNGYSIRHYKRSMSQWIDPIYNIYSPYIQQNPITVIRVSMLANKNAFKWLAACCSVSRVSFLARIPGLVSVKHVTTMFVYGCGHLMARPALNRSWTLVQKPLIAIFHGKLVLPCVWFGSENFYWAPDMLRSRCM